VVAVLTEPWRSIGRDGRNVLAAAMAGAQPGGVEWPYGFRMEASSRRRGARLRLSAAGSWPWYRARMAPPDPTAVQTMQAAWSAAGAAWFQVWVGAISATVNALVLIALAIWAARQQTRSRNARLYAAAVSVSHVLEIARTVFVKLHNSAPGAALHVQSAKADIGLALRTADDLPHDIDDAELASFVRNAATLVRAMDATIDRVVGTIAPFTVTHYLGLCATLEQDTDRELARLKLVSDRWRKRL